jgi:hypothetical protein
MNKYKIVYFTKYTSAGPSSRYRSYQYKNSLEENGFNITYLPLFPSQYIYDLYQKGKKNWQILLPQYIKRFFKILFLRNYDILFIEYELFPFMPYFFEKMVLIGKKNIVIDYDDATFHTYDKSRIGLVRYLCGKKIYKLVSNASLVITGSPYLTKMLSRYNNNIVEIPTSIEFAKYKVANYSSNSEVFKIGWIGSKNTSVNVLLLKNVFLKLQKNYKIELLLVGFDKNLLHSLDGINYQLIQWHEDTEVDTIRQFDVGIMPLENNFFNHGKCGFKLIQYMACGIPTISTPLEANVKIDNSNGNLFATTEDDWYNGFEKVLLHKAYFDNVVGKQNRKTIENHYCIEANSKFYIIHFMGLINYGKNNE